MERVRDRDRMIWQGVRVALVIVGLDLALKQTMIRILSFDEHYWFIDGWIGLQLTFNRKFAFGLGPDSSAIPFVALAALAILVTFVARGWIRLSPTTAIAIGLIVGGAVGNLIDRMRDHAVTDFFVLGPWPRFNLADSALTAGVGVLILAEFMSPGGRSA